MLKTHSDCFTRPIQIRVEQPNVYRDDNLIHSGKSVVEIDDDENVYQKQGLNFEGTQNYHHTLQMESDDDDFPPPYFLRNENNYKTRHRDSFIY